MTDSSPIVSILASQQRALVSKIEPVNSPGNMEGIFAFHVVNNDPTFPLIWNVDCATPAWLTENIHQVDHFPVLAAMGYTLRHFGAAASAGFKKAFTEGFNKLQLRDPFPDDRVSFAYQPLAFLGLALGALALGDTDASYAQWLVKVLKDQRHREPTPYHTLLFKYIRHLLTAEMSTIDDVHKYVEPVELALLLWAFQQGALRLLDPRADLSALQARLLHLTMTSSVEGLTASRAAVLWSTVNSCLMRSIEEVVLSRDHVAIVLRRFQDALRRWRWDDSTRVNHPIQWPITMEREVQDILWLILRSLFDDVVDEETLPRIGHSTYRADFGIPSLRLLVEAKYCRQASDFKNIEKEIMEDSVAYLLHAGDRYDRVLVFIYDHSSSVQEHGLTISALRQLTQIEDVIIVSRPSQLPA